MALKHTSADYNVPQQIEAVLDSLEVLGWPCLLGRGQGPWEGVSSLLMHGQTLAREH